MFDQSGGGSAQIFYTAFVAKSPNTAARPVTFVFNGGPGTASAFLNLGLVGARVAQLGPDGHDGTKVRLADNQDTWLAFTDLVLTDPVSTSWSRAAKPEGARGFWSVHSDAESMAKVIALYVAKNGRTGSPKFILAKVTVSRGQGRAPAAERDEAITQAEADGEILSFDIPDEVLERAASAEQSAFTLVYCTNDWYSCGWPE